MSYSLIKIIVEVGGIMPEIFTKHISDFDGLELLAVDTETFDMDVDDLFTTKREQYTMDVFSVCGKKGNTYYYGTFPATMFHEFYRKNGRSRWIQHNSQYDLKVFRKSGINWRELLIEDTMIMARLLGHTVGYGLKALRQTVLGLPERTKYKDVDRNNEEAYYMYAALDALDTYKLYEVFIKKIESEALEGVYTLEKEVMFPTVDMEWNGVEVDIELVLVLKEMLQKKIQPIYEKLEKMTNYINIGSPKQLQELFFVKLGIEPKDGWITNGGKKKKKEGMELSYVDYSVGVDTLMDISEMEGDAGEIADVILEYRKYTKLLSTYIDGFIPKLQRGRIHSHLDSLGTATGRFSSKNINLQNIAAKEFDEETHATTRALFIAKKGRKLITADYSQVELRTLGLISGDPSLVDVYKNNGDIHAQTARGIGIDRKAAKVVNFGVIYGMSKYGLKKALKKQAKVMVTEEKAQEMIDGYWMTYKKVRAMFTYVEGQVSKLGYVRSASGRKRRFYSGNQGDMRAANNMTIQGTAADIMKAGMVRVWRNIDPERATMVLQVHDEVTLEADEDYAEEAKKILEWGMAGAIKSMLDFPADAGIGNSWAESK